MLKNMKAGLEVAFFVFFGPMLFVLLVSCAIGLSPSADRRAHGDMSDADGAAMANYLRTVK